ncbi:MAG: hypothetical protein GY730_09720 [bacterium]|nr:hypothetical protein [bacterium]
MSKKHLITVLLIFIFPADIFSYAKNIWEINIADIFDAEKEGAIYSKYEPVILENKILLGTDKGIIKTIDTNTKEIEYITRLPINIEKIDIYGNKAVFYGRHRINNMYYYCAVNMKRKKLSGILKHPGALWKFDHWGIYENNKRYFVYDPKSGRNIYSQKGPSGMQYPVHTYDKRDVFFSKNYELMEMSVPKYGAGFLLSQHGKGQITKTEDVISFDTISRLPKHIFPDNLKNNILYYHRANGNIGRINIKIKKISWERKLFQQNMQIIGPEEYWTRLYYLVSYPENKKQKSKTGKIICLKKKNGEPEWLSEDLYFHNFSPVIFKKHIVSADTKNNLLLLNLKTGNTAQKIHIGNIPSKPIVDKNSVYIYTSDKLFRFDYTRFKP